VPKASCGRRRGSEVIEKMQILGRKKDNGQHCISRGHYLVCFPRRAHLRIGEDSFRVGTEGHVSQCEKAVEEEIYPLPQQAWKETDLVPRLSWRVDGSRAYGAKVHQ